MNKKGSQMIILNLIIIALVSYSTKWSSDASNEYSTFR